MGATLRKPHFPNPMLRLAAVEVHLICHGLQCADLIRFARCSKELFKLCADKYAWQHTLMDVFARRCMGSVQPDGPFALDVPVSLMLDSSYPPPAAADAPSPSELEQIVTSARLVKIRACSSKRISTVSWIALMSLPNFGRSLRIIDLRFTLMPVGPSVALLSLIVKLPKLTTLRFGLIDLYEDPAASLSLLAQAPALTALELRQIVNPMVLLAQCPKLKQLTVSMPHPTTLAQYCDDATRNNQPLETLSIDFHNAQLGFAETLPPVPLAESLENMRHFSVDRHKVQSAGKLSHLFSVPSLRTLRVLNVSCVGVLAKSLEQASTTLPFQLVVSLPTEVNPALVEIRRGRMINEGERGMIKVIRGQRETELRMS